MVPLVALKRSPRAASARRDSGSVSLKPEIEKVQFRKWGLADEEPSQSRILRRTWMTITGRVVAAYEKSYANFVKEQGPERVAEIDAALRRLNTEQQAHVTSLVGQGDGDPVGRVQAYIEQLGLLFKPTDLRDALSGKAEQPAPMPPRPMHGVRVNASKRLSLLNAARSSTLAASSLFPSMVRRNTTSWMLPVTPSWRAGTLRASNSQRSSRKPTIPYPPPRSC